MTDIEAGRIAYRIVVGYLGEFEITGERETCLMTLIKEALQESSADLKVERLEARVMDLVDESMESERRIAELEEELSDAVKSSRGCKHSIADLKFEIEDLKV